MMSRNGEERMKYPLIWLEKDVPKEERSTRKFPHTLSLGKLGKGQSFNQVKNQTRRGDCTC